MTSTTLLSDVVLPAATWYEKHDLSTTDMHPFVHAFTPAIDPPWEARTDFDAFHRIAQPFSELAGTHLGVRNDLVAVPLQHDTPARRPSPAASCATGGPARPPRCPGKTMPNFVGGRARLHARSPTRWRARPARSTARLHHQGRHRTTSSEEVADLARQERRDARGGAADGRPRLDTDAEDGEAILALSGTTNGRARRPGLPDTRAPHRAAAGRPRRGHEEKRITFADTQARPGAGDHQPGVVGQRDRRAPLRAVHRQRRAAQAVAHADRPDALLPRPRLDRTSSARRCRPIRPPLDMHRLFGEPRLGRKGELELTVRYLTPHSKWSIHSEYQDNLFMLRCPAAARPSG